LVKSNKRNKEYILSQKNSCAYSEKKMQDSLFRNGLFLQIACIVLVLLVNVSASEMKLPHTVKSSVLAVTISDSDISSGSVVAVSLEIVSGSGRVFIDTFPAAKIDTQVSARIAKDIACYYAGVDCNEIDFIYTIESQVSQISGPSAGVSLTALTYSALTRLPLLEGVVATGTINSGGFVGSVGGIEQKIIAASQKKINTVLIPFGEEFDPQKNTTYQQFGKTLGVQVIPVSDFSQVLEYMTGTKVSFIQESLEYPEFYTKLMSGISTRLCQKAQKTLEQIQRTTVSPQYEQYIRAYELYNRSILSINNSEYYSSASFCYGSLIESYDLSNITTEFFATNTKKTIENYTIPEYKTYADFLTYMLVQERIQESKKLYEQSKQTVEQKPVMSNSETKTTTNQTNNSKQNTQNQTITSIDSQESKIEKNQSSLVQTTVEFNRRVIIQAYLRMQTALEWATFFAQQGSPIQYTDIRISQACELKLLEILDRKNYISTYTTTAELESRISSIRTQPDNIMCLYEASKLKAELDVTISTYGLSANISSIVKERAQVVERLVVSQTIKKQYPIISYSYYQYAVSLVEYDPASALLYLQYALELADLPLYLGTQTAQPFVETTATLSFIKTRLLSEHAFTLGVCTGLIVCILCIRIESVIRAICLKKTKRTTIVKQRKNN
jgi:hypothetical protein